MARERRGLPKSPLGWLGFIGKIIYGVPAAVVGTVVLGTAWVATTTYSIAESKLFEGRNASGYESKVRDAVAEARRKTIEGWMSKLWGEVAFGPARDTLSWVGEKTRSWEAEAGFGRAGDEDGYNKDNSLAQQENKRSHDTAIGSYSREITKEADVKILGDEPNTSPRPSNVGRLSGSSRGRNDPSISR